MLFLRHHCSKITYKKMFFLKAKTKLFGKQFPLGYLPPSKTTYQNPRNASTGPVSQPTVSTSHPASRAKDPRAPATSAKVAGEALVGLGKVGPGASYKRRLVTCKGGDQVGYATTCMYILQGTRKHIPPNGKRKIIDSNVPFFWDM